MPAAKPNLPASLLIQATLLTLKLRCSVSAGEALPKDLGVTIRRVLAFCGLDFEQRCLDFHQTRRSVNTASSEQVRSPLNRRGLDGWTPYRSWLRELEQALGDARTNYRS